MQHTRKDKKVNSALEIGGKHEKEEDNWTAVIAISNLHDSRYGNQQ